MVQKQEGIERLILRPWRHLPGNRQVTEKLHHLPLAHLLRMAFSMKQDEAANPSHIGPFRADAVVLDPQGTTYRIENGRRAAGTHEAMKKGMVIYWKSSAIGTILDRGASWGTNLRASVARASAGPESYKGFTWQIWHA